MTTELIRVIPVLPSSNIERDVQWYCDHAGFQEYHSDHMYAVIYRENLTLHLQWHADTPDDPLLGGSVIRIYVAKIENMFHEFVKRGTVNKDAMKLNTAWGTNEFGFYDLNGNAIFVMEDTR